MIYWFLGTITSTASWIERYEWRSNFYVIKLIYFYTVGPIKLHIYIYKTTFLCIWSYHSLKINSWSEMGHCSMLCFMLIALYQIMKVGFQLLSGQVFQPRLLKVFLQIINFSQWSQRLTKFELCFHFAGLVSCFAWILIRQILTRVFTVVFRFHMSFCSLLASLFILFCHK